MNRDRVMVYWRRFMGLDINTKGLIGIFVSAIILSLVLRYTLLHARTFDDINFLEPWINHMRTYGLAGLHDNFANYNTPYLVLLWIFSFLPFSDVTSIKLLSILFDGVLAYSVYLVINHFKPRGYAKYLGVLAVLFAPTVIQNGALWAQCDGIYTSFIIFSFYAFLKGRMSVSWLLWGVAFAFKLQAIFFLPFLVFVAFYKRDAIFRGPLIAVGTFIVLTILPFFFGKSLIDTFGIYPSQLAPPAGVEMLAWFAPTAYQWTSNAYFDFVRRAGVLFAGFVGLAVVSLAFFKRYSDVGLLSIATLSTLALAFFLPQIHERYFYTAEIFLIILALINYRFIWAAIAMQIITTMAYITYFTGGNVMPPIPFAELSIGVFLIILFLTSFIYMDQPTKSNPAKRLVKVLKQKR